MILYNTATTFNVSYFLLKGPTFTGQYAYVSWSVLYRDSENYIIEMQFYCLLLTV